MKWLTRLREAHERLIRLDRATKTTRDHLGTIERLLAQLDERSRRQDEALKGVGERLLTLEQSLVASQTRLGELDSRIDANTRASSSAHAAFDAHFRDVEQHLKESRRRLKGLEVDLGAQVARLHTRLSRLRAPLDAPADQAFLDLARPLVDARRTLLGYDRLYILWQAVKNVAHLGLPAVEVGAFRGGSAGLIAHAWRAAADVDGELHVVDTFEGHLDRQLSDRDLPLQRGKFQQTSYDDVRSYLSTFANVRVHKGDATQLIGEWPERRYALLHLDVDLYEPTRRCLEYFAPRLASGGVIVLDDYGAPTCPGVAQAAGELLTHDRSAFHQWDTQTEQLVLIKR